MGETESEKLRTMTKELRPSERKMAGKTRRRRTDQTANHRPDKAIGMRWQGGVKNDMTVTMRGRT